MSDSNSGFFGELNNNKSRRSSNYRSNSFVSNNNTNYNSENLRPLPNTPRGRSSAFSENNLTFNNVSPNTPTATEPSRRNIEKLKESFLDNYWRIINLFLRDPRVVRHITLTYRTIFIPISGTPIPKLLRGTENILKSDTNASPPRTYTETKRILTKLLEELASRSDGNINKLTSDEFFMDAFGLTEDEISIKLKELHPENSVRLNDGKYSEKFMHVPGRFYRGLLDFYNYGDTFLEWRATTDNLSRNVLDYVSSGSVLSGIFALQTLKPYDNRVPKNSEIPVAEYIIIDSSKKPSYVQDTTSIPIYDNLIEIIEPLINTETMKELFRKKVIIKISPGVRAILESKAEYKKLLNAAFPPSPPSLSSPKEVSYQTRRLLAKGAIKPTKGGRTHNRRNRVSGRRTVKKIRT
jgi:hypothetical protein